MIEFESKSEKKNIYIQNYQRLKETFWVFYDYRYKKYFTRSKVHLLKRMNRQPVKFKFSKSSDQKDFIKN